MDDTKPADNSRHILYCEACGQKLDVSDVEALLIVPCPVCATGLVVPERPRSGQPMDPRPAAPQPTPASRPKARPRPTRTSRSKVVVRKNAAAGRREPSVKPPPGRSKVRVVVLLLGVAVGGLLLWFWAGGEAKVEGTEPQQPPQAAATSAPGDRDYSYSYWLNSWRQREGEESPDVLCFETGYYGFQLDMNDLARPRAGRIDDSLSYEQSLAKGTRRLQELAPAELEIALQIDGKTFRAETCRSGVHRGLKHLQTTRLHESGRLAMHYDIQGLVFRDEAGSALPCDGRLVLLGWPRSLTLTAELTPGLNLVDGPTRGIAGNGHCVVTKPVHVPHSPDLEPDELTLACWYKHPERMNTAHFGWLVSKNHNERSKGFYGLSLRKSVDAVMNFGGADGHVRISQNGPLSDDAWHHLALTYDGAVMRLYVNGRKQGEQAVNKPRVAGTSGMRIGQRADGRGAIIEGIYDQVRVWNRALSAKEIAHQAKHPDRPKDRSGLVLDKHFDEGVEIASPAWQDATLRMAFRAEQATWADELAVAGTWTMGEKKKLSLVCPFKDPQPDSKRPTIRVKAPTGQQVPVVFQEETNCYVAEVRKLKRSFETGWVKISDYDEFDLVVERQEGARDPLPFLLKLHDVANITGLVPLLTMPDGTPTGIPVQLSKNWHKPGHNGLRAYTLLPAENGTNRYRLRIVYSLYGQLPSASHGQLSLIGWGSNTRWDQLALASGGEMITFDVEMGPTDVAVCDVRLPFGRHTETGNPWGWSDAGWGGDWLGAKGYRNHKLTFAAMKTAYLAHGPCLTDVRYNGAYGSDRRVQIKATIQAPRSDDYGRTFQSLAYRFAKPVSADDAYLLRRHARAYDASIAYGNANGLLAEKLVTSDLSKGSLLVPPTELEGPGPWWIAFPGRGPAESKTWAHGSVSLIIRSYEATFDGTKSPNPYLMARVEAVKGNTAKLETWVIPPPDVERFNTGDQIVLDTEWVHLHRTVKDYGGLNEAYRSHLADNPQSWKTTYREVTGNDLKVSVAGGALRQTYPIVIRAESPEVVVDLEGGLGFVPIRFEGLSTAQGYGMHEVQDGLRRRLDQSVHGNDFWQTDYDPTSKRYRMSFNLPVDGKPRSRWVFTKQ